MGFRWNEWNIDHIARHGVNPEEAEYVVSHAQRPYPQAREDEKWPSVARGAVNPVVSQRKIFHTLIQGDRRGIPMERVERRPHRPARRRSGGSRVRGEPRTTALPAGPCRHKWRVVGRCRGGRWVQVIFIFDPEDAVFVIHARPLTDREKRRERRRER